MPLISISKPKLFISLKIITRIYWKCVMDIWNDADSMPILATFLSTQKSFSMLWHERKHTSKWIIFHCLIFHCVFGSFKLINTDVCSFLGFFHSQKQFLPEEFFFWNNIVNTISVQIISCTFSIVFCALNTILYNEFYNFVITAEYELQFCSQNIIMISKLNKTDTNAI